MIKITVMMFALIAPHVVWAAICDAGAYLDGTECRDCKYGMPDAPVYCPGDDMRYNCPTATQEHYNAIAAQFGHTLISNPDLYIYSKDYAPSVGYCNNDLAFRTSEGHVFLAECAWNGDNYYYPCVNHAGVARAYMYYEAGTGYYLSGWLQSRYYAGAKACTNKPANSYYTGAGTPDGNDCPWECNSGYGRHNNECFPLCAAGFVSLKSNGVSVNVYAEKLTTPSINISANGKTCYVSLSSSGSPTGAIYINYNGTTYHTID